MGEEEDGDDEDEEAEMNRPNPLLADLGTKQEHLSKQANLWFKRVSHAMRACRVGSTCTICITQQSNRSKI